MQWSKKGTHLLFQVRTKVLNNEWEDVFRKKYPHFRPTQNMATQEMKAVAWTTAPHFLMLSLWVGMAST